MDKDKVADSAFEIAGWLMLWNPERFGEIMAAHHDDLGKAVISLLQHGFECEKAIEGVRDSIARV